MRKIIIVSLILLVSLGFYGYCQEGDSRLKLGLSFPPVQEEKHRAFTAEHLNRLGIDRIRFAVAWEHIEPAKGKFKWAAFDKRIKFIGGNNLSLLLTVQSNGPSWACSGRKNKKSCVYRNEDDFKAFVEALLSRYSNKIDKIQFGNEWPSRWWYIGEADDYVRLNNILYDAVKKFSPKTKVVLGGISIGQLRGLAACEGSIDSIFDDQGKTYRKKDLLEYCQSDKSAELRQRVDYVFKRAQYDIVDIHLYDDPENWHIYYNTIRAMALGKPIIVSEFGGPNIFVEDYSDAYHAKRVGDYLATLKNMDIEEAYYFQLVEPKTKVAHSRSGLISAPNELKEKPAYKVLAEFNSGLKNQGQKEK